MDISSVSDVITEVEIQPQMEEVEIETLDDHDTIEIAVDDDDVGGLVDNGILDGQEEIVGYEDPNMALVNDTGMLMDSDEHPGPSPSSSYHHRSTHHLLSSTVSNANNNNKKFRRILPGGLGLSNNNRRRIRDYDPSLQQNLGSGLQRRSGSRNKFKLGRWRGSFPSRCGLREVMTLTPWYT